MDKVKIQIILTEVSEKLFFNADIRKSNADKRRFIVGSIYDYLRAICENLRSRRLFQISLAILIMLIVCSPKPCCAAAISLTTGSNTWALGIKDPGTTTTSTGSPSTWAVTNVDAQYAYFTIHISAISGTWVAGCDKYGAPAATCFYLRYQPGNVLMTGSPYTFATGVAPTIDPRSFGLSLELPSGMTAHQGVEQSITVTLTAVTHVCSSGGGWWDSGRCWRVSGSYQSNCDSVCLGRGGCLAAGCASLDVQQAVCHHFYGGHYNPLGITDAPRWNGGTSCCAEASFSCTTVSGMQGNYRICPCGY